MKSNIVSPVHKSFLTISLTAHDVRTSELPRLNASHLKSELPASTTTAFLTSYLVGSSYTMSTGVNSDSSYPIVYSYADAKILNPSVLILIAAFQSLSIPL